MQARTVAVILLLLFLVDGFPLAEARFIHSYNAAVRNHHGLVSTNPKGNAPVLPGKVAVGDNSFVGARDRRTAHGIGKKAKGPSHEHNAEKLNERDMVFHPLGHSPGIGHDNPPDR